MPKPVSRRKKPLNTETQPQPKQANLRIPKDLEDDLNRWGIEVHGPLFESQGIATRVMLALKALVSPD
jgi:hypothetical protein